MSKALVLSGVSFGSNALTQVNLLLDIPCTGISLSQSSVSLTSLTATTLTATLTPANTTDAVVWTSSDNTVATVANGVVTPLKAGSATITATCGTHSATCAFTIRNFLDVPLEYGYYFMKKANTGGDGVQVSGGPSTTTYGGSVITSGSGRYAYDSTNLIDGHCYPIKIPTGATKLAITVPNQSIKASVTWVDSTTSSTLGANYVLFVSGPDSPWASTITAGNNQVSVPGSTEDSFYLSVYLSGNTLTQAMLDEITVEALYT